MSYTRIASFLAAFSLFFLHLHSASASVSPPSPISLSFPPFSLTSLACQFDPSLNLSVSAVCTQYSTPTPRIVFSNDNDVISVRYQFKQPVQLWQKGSPFVASFSTQFTLEFHRDAERSVKRVFGGGIAFAITPTINVDDSGPESFGLFKIDATGKPAGGVNPRTVAIEIDTSRDAANTWDPQIPHVGIDINSVNSVMSKYLWNGTAFIDRKVAVFIDYDAQKETMAVRFQNVSAKGKADKSKSVLFLSYSGIKLAHYVNEMSYVGFSSRVPQSL